MYTKTELEKLNGPALNAAHYEAFGVYPKTTGVRFFEDINKVRRDVIKAILDGKPYTEDDVPEGVTI